MCDCGDYSDGSRYLCPVDADILREQCERLAKAEGLVSLQAEDESLWFVAETIAEARLQEALRLLHKTVEREEMVFAEGERPF